MSAEIPPTSVAQASLEDILEILHSSSFSKIGETQTKLPKEIYARHPLEHKQWSVYHRANKHTLDIAFLTQAKDLLIAEVMPQGRGLEWYDRQILEGFVDILSGGGDYEKVVKYVNEHNIVYGQNAYDSLKQIIPSSPVASVQSTK